MAKLKVKFFVVTSLVSVLTLFPALVSQVAAREVVGRPGGAEAVEGPRGNIVVGTRVNTLPATAHIVVVRGTTYYVDGAVYYQADTSSADVVYVVVPAPQ